MDFAEVGRLRARRQGGERKRERQDNCAQPAVRG
jgi:hypothetical protein